VAYAEIEPDLDTAMARLGESEHNARWSAWFEELIVNLTDARGNLMTFTEVWHLD
jgi:L-rhamnose mutarotase